MITEDYRTDWQAELDTIELKISDERRTVEQIERTLSDHQDRQAAARELLEKSPLPRDKRDAETVLADCAEVISTTEVRLRRARGGLAVFEEKKKNFPYEQLRAQRHLEELRRRCGRVPRRGIGG